MRLNALLPLLLALPALSGCADGLQFKNDHRLTFSTPEAREQVTAPVTVRWSMDDFESVGLDGSSEPDRGVFAVFVDRAPMPVGKDLRWLFRDDSTCTSNPACPDPTLLATNDVHVTTEPSLVLDQLPRVQEVAGEEPHDITVVLLDGQGRRLTESAWYLPILTEAAPA